LDIGEDMSPGSSHSKLTRGFLEFWLRILSGQWRAASTEDLKTRTRFEGSVRVLDMTQFPQSDISLQIQAKLISLWTLASYLSSLSVRI
jgi:hypothetical protein